MVAALAFEPFVQQVVSYSLQQVPVSSISVAYRAQTYDNGHRTESGGPVLGPEPGMKAAVYQGLFGAVSAGPEPTCGTGNCSFPDFTSLAVCSQCINVTDQTTRRSIRSIPQSQKSSFVYRHNVTYDLPGGLRQSIVYGSYDDLDGQDLSFGPAMASKTGVSSEMTKSMFNVSQPIVAMSMLQFPYVEKEGYDGRYADGRPIAFECALYFCMHIYRSNVSNGHTTTETLSTYHDPTLPTIDGDVPGTFEVDAAHLVGSTDPQLDPTFTIPAGTISTVSDWLNNTFAGHVLVRISVVQPGLYVNDVLQVFSKTTGPSALFSNVATSMTNYIRSVAPADTLGSSLVPGIAYRTESFVHVKWVWFILPVALAALTYILFAATVVITMRRGMQV